MRRDRSVKKNAREHKSDTGSGTNRKHCTFHMLLPLFAKTIRGMKTSRFLFVFLATAQTTYNKTKGVSIISLQYYK